MAETLFTKIAEGIIPSVKLYEDNICFVILDINPIVKGHALVISREPYPNMASTPESILEHMILVARKVDGKLREQLHCDGTNVLVNNDRASGQEIPHLHFHVIPRFTDDGRRFGFEHDTYADGEMVEMGRRLILQ